MPERIEHDDELFNSLLVPGQCHDYGADVGLSDVPPGLSASRARRPEATSRPSAAPPPDITGRLPSARVIHPDCHPMASRRVQLLPRVWDPALHSAVNTTDGITVTPGALMITPIGARRQSGASGRLCGNSGDPWHPIRSPGLHGGIPRRPRDGR